MDYDLIIVGGGMAGASLAVALSGHGLSMLLIEAAEPAAETIPNYDDRAIALAYGSSKILQSIGVWQGMRHKAEPIRSIHVSERGGFGFTHLEDTREEVPALGYVITARDLGSGLLAALRLCKDVEVMAPASVVGLSQDQESVQISVEQQGQLTTLSSKLLVAADGGNSFIRKELGLPVRSWKYGQNAVIANLTPGRNHDNVAYERFTDQGPVAFLPMSDNRCALVWTVNDETIDEVMAYSDEHFLQEVQARFGWRLGRLQKVGKRSAYPLVHLHAPNSVSGRVAVIGNAAHSLHPIAGQGFNLGIRDVAVLAEVVVDAQKTNMDVGGESVLKSYEEWRKRDQQGVAMATDGLVRLFTNPLGAVRLMRNMGMLTVDALPFLRRPLARSAMGLHGKLPKLTRGLPLD